MLALILGLLVVLAASPAGAVGVSLYGGVTKDWVRLGEGEDFIEFESPMAGLSYNVAHNKKWTSGLALGYRASQDQFFASQFTVEHWGKTMDNGVEWFGGAQLETWARSDEFNDTQFLAGPRGGIRFDIRDLCFELSGSWSLGGDDMQRRGAFAGLYLEPPKKNGGGY